LSLENDGLSCQLAFASTNTNQVSHKTPPHYRLDPTLKPSLCLSQKVIAIMTINTEARVVRLFRNGRNQALRIPREFELQGNEAILRKDGDRLIIEPQIRGGLLAVLQSLAPIDEVFPDIDADLIALTEVSI
jgi:antitoxin VapB